MRPDSILDLIDSHSPQVDPIVEWLNKGYLPIAVAFIFNITQFSVEYLLSDPSYPILSETERILNRIRREREEFNLRTAKRLISGIRKVAKHEQSKHAEGM